jgi:hypothetical protein
MRIIDADELLQLYGDYGVDFREYLKTTPTRKYCSDECKELMKINLKRESQKTRKANRKREIAQERRDDLNRILRDAAEHGMSYGKYVAYLNGRGNQCE